MVAHGRRCWWSSRAVYTITDPPIKALRKVIPPLRLGSIMLDLSFLLVMLGAYLLLVRDPLHTALNQPPHGSLTVRHAVALVFRAGTAPGCIKVKVWVTSCR